MAEKFVTFEEAVRELGISADDLKELMEQGKIRHFMDSGKVKFRRSDLDALKVSLGITEPDAELTLAPPEEVPPIPEEPLPSAEEEVPPPPGETPTYKEDLTIEPLEEDLPPKTAMAAAAAEAAKKQREEAAAVGEEEEVASLDDLAVSAGAEEDGRELTSEEAEFLGMQGTVRGYEEAKAANVGMTVVLVVSAVALAFGVMVLLSFPMGINPFSSLTSFFVNQ